MKKAFLTLLIFVGICSFTINIQQDKPPILVKANAVSYLYGSKALKTEGSVSKQNGNFMRFSGPATMEWSIQIPTSGTYEVRLSHSVKTAADGNSVSIAVGNSTVNYTLVPTQGVFGIGSYERILLKDKLELNAGIQQLTLTVPATAEGPVMDLRAVELVSVAGKSAIEADERKAIRSRAKTDWLAKAGYGLMFHYTSQSVSRDGSKLPYEKAIDQFDVDKYAEMVEQTGAKYVIFTIGHAQQYCPAPIASWEKAHPGMTTKRDLIAEIANALNKKGIKLVLYMHSLGTGNFGKVDNTEFYKTFTDILKEFGDRYKDKVAGYWFDCWYQIFEGYPDIPIEDFFKVCKTGNKDRIICLNSWIYPSVSPWQEYWAGETTSPVALPKNGTIERGPGMGLRYQSLLIMEPYWVQDKAAMPPPRFTAEQLSKYISECMQQGGAVTINMGIYQDGTVDEKALQVMKDVAAKIRK